MGVQFESGHTPWNKGVRGTKNPKVADRLRKYFADPSNRAKQSGERASNWKGDNVGYNAMHTRLRKTQKHICINCGPVKKTQFALIHGCEKRVSSNGRPFSTDPNDYQEMCVTCHNRYDIIKRKK